MNKKFSTLVAAALVAGGFSSSALAQVVSPGDTIAYNKLVNGQKYQISTKLGYATVGEVVYYLDTLQVKEDPSKADSKFVLTLRATATEPSTLFKTTVTADGGKKYVKLSVDGKEIQLKKADGDLLANTAADYKLATASTVSRLDSATVTAATLQMDSVQLFANSGKVLTIADGATVLSVAAPVDGNATSFRFSIPNDIVLPIANLNAYLFNGFILNAKNSAGAITTEANGLFNKKLVALEFNVGNTALTGTDAATKAVMNILGAANLAATANASKTFYLVSNEASDKLLALAETSDFAYPITDGNKEAFVELFNAATVVAVDKVKSESTVNVTKGYGYVFTNKTGKELLEAEETDVPMANAWFTTKYNRSDASVTFNADGSLKSTDNIVINVTAKFPASDGKMTETEKVRPQIATIGGKSYLYTVPADTKVTQWSQIGFGATSQVAYAAFKGKSFNVISAEKDSEISGMVLASMTASSYAPRWEKAADVMKSKPEGQWVVTYVETAKDSKIFEFVLNNRETGKTVNMGTTIYKVDNATDKYYVYDTSGGNGLVAGADTIQLIETAAFAHPRLGGYAHSEVVGDKFDAVKLATTAYRLGIKNGDTDGIVYVQNSAVHNNTLSVAVKEDEGLSFYLVPATSEWNSTTPDTVSYGINLDSKRYYENILGKNETYKADSLRAVVYKIQERGNKRYVKLDEDGKYVLDNNVNAAQTFLLKEREDGQYVILPVSYGGSPYDVTVQGKVYANIGDGFLHVESNMYRKNIADAFGLYESEAPKYANILKDINKGDTTLAKINLSSVQNHAGDGFYMLTPGANNFLYEGVPSVLKAEGGLAYDSTAFSLVIDTAYVNRGAGSETMPLYYIAMNGAARQDSVGPLHSGEKDEFGHPIVCTHFAGNDTVIGKYLFAMYDSILYAKDKAIKSEDNCYHYTNTDHFARLRFVDAKHIKDTMIIANNLVPAALKDTLRPAAISATTLPERKVYEWMSGFEVTDPKLPSEHFGRNFQLTNDNFGLFAFEINPANDEEYAIYSPATGYYVAYMNGNVVMAPQASYYTLNVGSKNNPIVSNDDIETTEVSVIAGAGSVTINNAAGKSVAISNILGQTLVNTVLTSDNATIAVPAGIVVVAVEGEAAVKAIVK